MQNYLLKQINKDILDIIEFDLPWIKLSNTKVLVTGANGFIGNYLVRTLLKLNEIGLLKEPLTVYAMVRDKKNSSEKFSDLVNNKYLKFFEWDLNKFLALPEFDLNYIFHAASNASPRFYNVDPTGTILPNTIGTAHLLELLRKSSFSKNDKGFIFLSSSEIYGQNVSINKQNKFDNENKVSYEMNSFRNCYSDSKKMGETMCKAWNDQYGIPTFVARIFHTYGPGLSKDDGRVFSDFIFNVIDNIDVKVLGSGKALRSYCYISDTIRAFFTILFKGKTSFSYDVGNPNAEMNVLDLAKMLVNLYPNKNLKVLSPNLNNENHFKKEFNVIKPKIETLQEIGWSPKINPSEGFKKTIDCQIN